MKIVSHIRHHLPETFQNMSKKLQGIWLHLLSKLTQVLTEFPVPRLCAGCSATPCFSNTLTKAVMRVPVFHDSTSSKSTVGSGLDRLDRT